MRSRIPPSERIKQEIRAVLEGHERGGHPLDRLVRSGAQYLLQKALEEEVEEELGDKAEYAGLHAYKTWR